jgi:hypothetical protein
MRPMRTWLACLTLIFVTSCATTTATECGWVTRILPSKDDILTRGTMIQIVAHNRNVMRFCR